MPFLSPDTAAGRLADRLGFRVDSSYIEDLAAVSILPTYKTEDGVLMLEADVLELGHVLERLSKAPRCRYVGKDLFNRGRPAGVALSDDTDVLLTGKFSQIAPCLSPAVRNLAGFLASHEDSEHVHEALRLPYVQGAELVTGSGRVHEYVKEQMARIRLSTGVPSGSFAGTAHYMGSKRGLGAFLVEALTNVLPVDGVVLDIMCGSGAAAGAFSRTWDTRVSDAQRFCQILAVVQGGGFSARDAERLLNRLLPIARDHAAALQDRLRGVVEHEDQLFHGDITDEQLSRYRQFIQDTTTYPSGVASKGWNPQELVTARQREPQLFPYCLFTCYFANLFFGVRQCVEIDSLRYAIDQLEDGRDREWALGALVAAVSDRSTNYGGHFAQPRFRTAMHLSMRDLGRTVEKRASSIVHEFGIRLTNLARESEHVPRPIVPTSGPWEVALDVWKQELPGRPVAVYLDAPYKREEYSRYYHLLETLVLYNYPSCVGKGKIPDKQTGERFQSEFFSKTRSRVEQAFVNIISRVLGCGYLCAWSYSDNGDADIGSVVRQVEDTIPCVVRSFSTPYEHKPQGRQRSKLVTEYLLLFQPEQRHT